MTSGIFSALMYVSQYKRAKNYVPLYIIKTPSKKYRIAAFVTSFNEDPETVRGTLVSVLVAARSYGNCDVFLLDDSTNEQISEELRSFCEKMGVTYVHRTHRRGYKAGAINDALRKFGEHYDLVAIFDADQRPSPNFFHVVSAFFDDPSIAFVQVPQYYSETYTKIAKGAWYQQMPFLRVIMRGRNLISAFSLGSGTVFRISALREVGYLKEDTVTEDIATSIKLHAKGYKSLYIDYPGIIYGEPPLDLNAYLKQQGRWSLGGFQLLMDLLKLDLPLIVFMDYLAGVMYWFQMGLFRLIELLAPVIFLDFNVSYLVMNPILYSLVYFPAFILLLILYLYSMRNYDYGLKGFFLHKTVEMLAFPSVFYSFISWILRRRKPFTVTPKGKINVKTYLLIPYVIVLVILIVTVVIGILKILNNSSNMIKDAIVINMFWTLYFIPYLSYGVLISLENPKEVRRVLFKRGDLILDQKLF